jgi:hypothetical protein
MPFPTSGIVGLAERPGLSPLFIAVSGDGRVWRSTDAAVWERSATLTFAGSGNVHEITGVIYARDRFVIAGFTTTSADLGIALAAELFDGGLVWTSTDGKAWKAATLGEAFKGRWIVDLVRSPDGLRALVAGWEMCCPAIAASADGASWSLTPFSESGGAPTAIAVLADGRVLAVGLGDVSSGPCADGGGGGATWTSKDTRNWIRSGQDFGCDTMTGVAAGPKGIVATGGSEGSWFSTDGRKWVATKNEFRPGGAVPIGVSSDGTFLAVGNETIWESVDGRSWVPSASVPGSEASFAGDVVIGCDTPPGTCVEAVIQH